MYNLNSYNFGEKFRIARKTKEMSIQELSNIIHKSSTTIYKYERNEVIPDIITVLEICNALEINFDTLTNQTEGKTSKENSTNPFLTDEIYLYYPSSVNKNENKLTEMRLKLKLESGIMKVYFYINETDTIFYTGNIESTAEYSFITLKNFNVINPRLEDVMIMINLQYSSDDVKSGIIVGLRNTINAPSIKKCVLLNHKIKDSEKEEILKKVQISEEELIQIKNDKFWYPNIDNSFSFKCI